TSFVEDIIKRISEKDLPENLPQFIIDKFQLVGRFEAIKQIHFPSSISDFNNAVRRIKFDELFFSQLRINLLKLERTRFSKGWVFDKVGDYFNNFYKNYLPFDLTNAQKKVIKEIRNDTNTGKQMNRLLQGDVGSGKTIVALLAMLISADNGFQSVLMAPTEILANQHFNALTDLLKSLDINIKLLTVSTKIKERRKILEEAINGELHILIGTHAVIEEKVQFKNLGFAVVDEQHKFGVAQRAAIWKKNTLPPHILVMTATPIPRTLALTAYGDLDYSVIDELPPGRKPVNTIHRNEKARPQVMEFIREQIALGRQAYLIYPLIEESSKLDYENLMKGYEEVKSFFPEPRYWISMVHGKQPAEQKETNMKRFVSKDTQIMVGTTVIEVGINVPNATVMVIESAEKFGLSQLHQLRGRVGRGADQSFCILLSGPKMSNDAKDRLNIMVETNDGFKVAEKDLEIRGPGEIEGTKQSGVLNFKLANILTDRNILEAARKEINNILSSDPDLDSAEHLPIKQYLRNVRGKTLWSKIS
ncbi:MAG: ATP-dependent DNA helicase RecG, partial [Ferruginibacter sp.]